MVVFKCFQSGLNLNLCRPVKSSRELSKTTNIRSSKLNESADDNFKVDENGRKSSKRVENTVGKGEIARYKQFPLFPQCFQKT